MNMISNKDFYYNEGPVGSHTLHSLRINHDALYNKSSVKIGSIHTRIVVVAYSQGLYRV